MANIADNITNDPIKMLLLGDSGSGKTGSLASLAHAGYNVRIIDLDNGLPALRNLLIDPKTPYAKDAYLRVSTITLNEKATTITATPQTTRPTTVWNKLIGILNHWKDGDEDFGPISKWTDKEVLVIDSLSFVGYAAMNFSGMMNTKNTNPLAIYGAAQTYVRALIENLYGDDIKCNVIITAHIQFLDNDNTISQGYPLSTVGRGFAPILGRYFNSVLMVRSEGSNRRIYTTPQNRVELKNQAPLRVRPYYDIAFGLAEFFKDAKIPAPPVVVPISQAAGA